MGLGGPGISPGPTQKGEVGVVFERRNTSSVDGEGHQQLRGQTAVEDFCPGLGGVGHHRARWLKIPALLSVRPPPTDHCWYCSKDFPRL